MHLFIHAYANFIINPSWFQPLEPYSIICNYLIVLSIVITLLVVTL